MVVVKKAYRDLGLRYEEKALSLPCDAFSFKEVSGTEVVIIGPVGSNYHGIDEYVEVDSVLNLIKLMVWTAVNYCT
jgi:acetylornithine deacetylase/succinyl-diaminopimelate desuccinylase-like protein